jgi:hypothetical protein
MIHIYTVKWGTKYSSKYVNKIYQQCKKHATSYFKFYCLTEDPSGLHSDIESIPFPEDNYYEKWWNKLYLFDENVVKQKGEKLFLDLDVIVQSNLDSFIQYSCQDKIVFVKTHWHDLEKMYEDTKHIPHKYTDLNSSILRWNDEVLNTEEIRKFWKMIKDYPGQMFFYFRGLDNLFYNKFNHKNIKYFPQGWVYSYNYGYMYPNDVEKNIMRKTPFVCLFDSMENPNDVKIEFSD